MVYGFNGKDNVLASSEIEIDKSESNGVFNVILNAISAGEIGKITTDEGKPLYKIVGEIKSTEPRDYISLSTLQAEVAKRSAYKFTNIHLKSVIHYLNWAKIEQFEVLNPSNDIINDSYREYIWIDTTDKIKESRKVVFSITAIEKITEIINDSTLHVQIFKKKLDKKLVKN